MFSKHLILLTHYDWSHSVGKMPFLLRDLHTVGTVCSSEVHTEHVLEFMWQL